MSPGLRQLNAQLHPLAPPQRSRRSSGGGTAANDAAAAAAADASTADGDLAVGVLTAARHTAAPPIRAALRALIKPIGASPRQSADAMAAPITEVDITALLQPSEALAPLAA